MTNAAELLDELRELARRRQVAAFGVADMQWLQDKVPGLFDRLPRTFPLAVAMGIRLQDAVIDGLADRPTPLYFHLYRQANYALDRAAFEAAELLQSAGYASLAVPASQIICRRPMVGHISHKLIGWAAGLGWIGRSTLLVHPQFGARMRYVTVLTDAALPPGRPIQQDCGPCRDCIAACPAHAIGETREQFGLDACFEKLTEFSKLEGIGQHICGICVRVCRGG